ncbi:hypothetical protein EV363DRAFT_1168993 [Boletus edulis]|nr:hypothetical protein EV363DRAFT_1168993 [Boletus edulis]
MQWEGLATNAPHCAPYIKAGLDWAQEYYQRMGQTRAYITVPRNVEIPATGAGHVCLHSTLAMCYYGLPTIKVRAPSQPAPQAVDQEFIAYIMSVPSPEGTHPLAFWEVRSIICIYQYVISHLNSSHESPSAVPCERVFSSSSETNTKKRNRISPLLMEALQMLKFWLKKDRLNFTKGWITPQKDMVFDEDSDDLLGRLFSTTDASSLDDILGAIARVEGDKVSGDTVIFA